MKIRILTVPVLLALLITTASAQYTRIDLVSNQPGMAPNTDGCYCGTPQPPHRAVI